MSSRLQPAGKAGCLGKKKKKKKTIFSSIFQENFTRIEVSYNVVIKLFFFFPIAVTTNLQIRSKLIRGSVLCGFLYLS